MTRQLERITLANGQIAFLWRHTDTTSSGATISVGETQHYRRIADIQAAQDLQALADTVLAEEDNRTATAQAAAEAARLAELERWNSLTPEEQAAEIAANNPPPPPWRVSKDTLLGRVDAAGKTAECMAIISSLSQAEQFLWTNFAWFWSNNERIRAMIAGVGLNPNDIMAPDPYAP